MAARTNKRLHSERDKRRILASQLLNRSEFFANGTVELSAAQVQAAPTSLPRQLVIGTMNE